MPRKNLLRKPRNPIKILLETGRSREAVKSEYWTLGRRFLTKFHTRFYRINGRTFAVDIKRTHFEAPFGVVLSTYDAKQKTEKTLFEAKIDFQHGAVVVSFQGVRGGSGEVRQFESGAKMPVANFLCALIEKEAKRLKFNQVKIRRAQSIPYYEDPLLKEELKRTSMGKTAANLRYLYRKSIESIEGTDWYSREVNNARMRIQSRMRKLVNGVAESRDYLMEKDFFVKNL